MAKDKTYDTPTIREPQKWTLCDESNSPVNPVRRTIPLFSDSVVRPPSYEPIAIIIGHSIEPTVGESSIEVVY